MTHKFLLNLECEQVSIMLPSGRLANFERSTTSKLISCKIRERLNPEFVSLVGGNVGSRESQTNGVFSWRLLSGQVHDINERERTYTRRNLKHYINLGVERDGSKGQIENWRFAASPAGNYTRG